MDEGSIYGGSAVRRGTQLPHRFRDLLHDLLQQASRGLGRLEFIKAACASLVEFSASDVQEVYQTIKGVRGEIEQAKGRIQYLERMVGMSTIQVTLTPVLPDQPIVEPEGVERAPDAQERAAHARRHAPVARRRRDQPPDRRAPGPRPDSDPGLRGRAARCLGRAAPPGNSAISQNAGRGKS